MKKRVIGKKAQEVFGLSFGMIFAIILIVFFIIIAGIAINAFLKSANCTKVALFVDDFKDKINEAWISDGIKDSFNGNLPNGIEKVCFANLTIPYSGKDASLGDELGLYEDENMFLFPMKKACGNPAYLIEHLNLDLITNNGKENPYCIDADSGKIIIGIEKESNEMLVRVRR